MLNIDEHTPRRRLKYSPLSRTEILTGLAHHEAGHAVLGMEVGMSCAHIRLNTITQGDATGWTGAVTWAPSYLTDFFAVAVVLGAAGEAADRHHLRESALLGDPTAQHDRDAAINILAHSNYRIVLDGPAPPVGEGTTWSTVTTAAEARVMESWPRIQTVAQGILHAPDYTISGDQAAELAGISNPAESWPPGHAFA